MQCKPAPREDAAWRFDVNEVELFVNLTASHPEYLHH